MKKRVLLLCTGNSARSQMAEGLLRYMAGDRFDVFSAGTHPVGLNPSAVEVMREIGIDIAHHRSKNMREFVDQSFDYVVTVCDRARDTCPRWPDKAKFVHWSFKDPASVRGSEEERRIAFQEVRDLIRTQIRSFVESEDLS